MTVKNPTQHTPRFSIISITLNNLAGLQLSYDSLAEQSERDFEWVVIDVGSADGTAAWLEGLVLDCAGFTHVSEADAGLYDAMNKGLALARGDYVLFLNGGDLLAAGDVLKRLVRDSDAAGTPDFIYGDAYEEMQDGTLFLKTAKDVAQILRGMITHHQAMLYKRAAISDARYNLEYKLAADYEFTLRFLQRTKAVCQLDYPICVFEAGGISQSYAGQARAEEFQIRRTHKVCSGLDNMLIYARQSLAYIVRRFSPALYRALR